MIDKKYLENYSKISFSELMRWTFKIYYTNCG